MNIMRNCKLLSALFLYVLFAGNAVAADQAPWAELKKGGYVLLIRHGPTDTLTHSTHPRADFENCVGQNNLSPEGQLAAKRIGKTFKKRHIPIGEVLAGPYCRTQDTARLAFGKYKVWDALDLATALPDEEANKRNAQVAERVGAYTGKKNLVLVTHKPNVDALTLELIEPGTVLILKPEGNSGFQVIGRINQEDLGS